MAFPLSCSQLRPPFQRKPDPRWALTPCSVPRTSCPLMNRQGLQVQALALGGSQMLRHLFYPGQVQVQEKNRLLVRPTCVSLSNCPVQGRHHASPGPGLGWVCPVGRSSQHHVHTSRQHPATCVHHSAWTPAVFQTIPQTSHAAFSGLCLTPSQPQTPKSLGTNDPQGCVGPEF